MIFNIVLGIVMFASMIGMIFCAKRQHVNSLAQPASVVLLIVIVLCALTFIIHNTQGPDINAIRANDLTFKKAKTYVLGKKIAELNPQGKVLFVVASTTITNPTQKAMIEGFKEGAGSGLSKVLVVAPPVKIPKDSRDELVDDPMLIEEMVTAKDFNKMLSLYKGYNIVVTTIGLPDDVENLTIWAEFDKNPKKSHKLAFVSGDTSKFAPLVKLGLVQAIVHYKKGVNYETPPPADLGKAFDLRYMLITKDNIDQVIKDHPNFFDK